MLIAMPFDGSTSISMSLSGEIETVTKLNKKYLPEPFVVEITDDGYGNYTTNITSYEIVDAIKQGQQVYACINNDITLPLNKYFGVTVKFLDVNDSQFKIFTILDNIVTCVKFKFDVIG